MLAVSQTYQHRHQVTAMSNDEFLKKFQSHLKQSLTGAEAMGDEAKQVIKSALTKTLKSLDLVTQEDFEVQKTVLKRSREKIDQLEEKITALEGLVKSLTSN